MRRILVAEDNRLERKILLHILSSHFGDTLKIDAVANGDDAIHYLEHQTYDLIITDLIMPKVEGIQLIRLINEKYTSSKIIAISGSNPYYLYMAKKIGIDGLFTKPLDSGSFVAKVSELLNIKAVNLLAV